MNILFDVRPLLSPVLTGVGEYSYHLLNNLLTLDKDNTYYLFYNLNKKPFLQHLPLNRGSQMLVPCHYPNKLFNLGLASHFLKLDEIIKKQYKVKIDICFFPNLGFISTGTKTSSIITVHDLSFEIHPDFFSFKRRLWHKAVRPLVLLQKCDKIIAVSQNTKNDLTTIYCLPPEKITVIYPGLNDHINSPTPDPALLKKIKKRYSLPESFILYLGTLEPRKNIVSIINAFEKIKQPVFLVIAGPYGWNYRHILQRKNNSPKKNKIIFTGFVKEEDKKYLYFLAKVFVFPSFYEGFGFPPLEAARCGCPVITSANSSLGETNQNGALYVDPFNINQLAHLINLILENKTLRNSLIWQAKKNCDRFHWSQTAQKVKELFSS